MGIVFQLTLLVLVLYSLLLCIVVPFLYSSASNWAQAKNVLLVGSLIWVGLVIAVGVLNFLK